MMNMELAVSRSLSEAGPQMPSLVNQPSHTVSPEQVTASNGPLNRREADQTATIPHGNESPTGPP